MRHRREPRPRYKSTRIGQRGRDSYEGEERRGEINHRPCVRMYVHALERREERRVQRRRVFASIGPINRFGAAFCAGLSGFRRGGGRYTVPHCWGIIRSLARRILGVFIAFYAPRCRWWALACARTGTRGETRGPATANGRR